MEYPSKPKKGFWNCCITEYQLVVTDRMKWCLPFDPIQEGEIILILDVKLPWSRWMMGV